MSEIHIADIKRTLLLGILAFALLSLLAFIGGGFSSSHALTVIIALLAFLICASIFDLLWLNAKRRRTRSGRAPTESTADVRQQQIRAGRKIASYARVISIAIITLYGLGKILALYL